VTVEAAPPGGETTAGVPHPDDGVRRQDRAGTAARTMRELPVLFLVALVIAFLVKTFLAQAFYIPSGSMLPQLQLFDRVVVSKVAHSVKSDGMAPGVASRATTPAAGEPAARASVAALPLRPRSAVRRDTLPARSRDND
jgi:hypothetical protein